MEYVIVDALVELVHTDPKTLCDRMDFLCHSVASGRAVVNPSTTLKLLEHLSSNAKGIWFHTY